MKSVGTEKERSVAPSVDEQRGSQLAGLGVLAVMLSVVLLVGCVIEANTGIRGMPRFWHANQPLWLLIGLAGVGGGVWLLAPFSSATHTTKWRPSRTGLRFRQLTLYTRDSCPLCDDAVALLTAYQRWLPHLTLVNIDTDPQLAEKYGTSIPVVAFDGKIRFRGRIAPELLQRLIEGTPPV